MNRSDHRMLQLFAILAAWAFIVLARLAQVQLLQHDAYVVRAQRQQERTLSLEPVRGSILDRKGRVLAESVAAVSVYADPQAIVDSGATARENRQSHADRRRPRLPRRFPRERGLCNR